MATLLDDDRKVTTTQITTYYNLGMRRSLKGRMLQQEEDHTRCHACQLRTGT